MLFAKLPRLYFETLLRMVVWEIQYFLPNFFGRPSKHFWGWWSEKFNAFCQISSTVILNTSEDGGLRNSMLFAKLPRLYFETLLRMVVWEIQYFLPNFFGRPSKLFWGWWAEKFNTFSQISSTVLLNTSEDGGLRNSMLLAKLPRLFF